MNKPDWAERLERSRKRAYDKGVQAERERIIELLQSTGRFERWSLKSLITLIKGEK
jgi:hypothetical protein